MFAPRYFLIFLLFPLLAYGNPTCEMSPEEWQKWKESTLRTVSGIAFNPVTRGTFIRRRQGIPARMDRSDYLAIYEASLFIKKCEKENAENWSTTQEGKKSLKNLTQFLENILAHMDSPDLGGLYNDVGFIVPRGTHEHYGTDDSDCYTCHASGLVAIHGPVDPRDRGAIDFINRIIKSGNVESEGANFFAHIGPSYGSNLPVFKAKRTADYIKLCSKGALTSIDDQNKIRSALECATCHDNKKRSRINPFNGDLTKRYILSGLMPPGTGAALTPKQRQSLYDCLISEYSDTLTNWLQNDGSATSQEPNLSRIPTLYERLQKWMTGGQSDSCP